MITNIISAIPQISPLEPFLAVAPFIIVIIIGVLREGIEDYKKHTYDTTYNNSKTFVYKNENFVEAKWMNIKVGDLIKVVKNETVPADLLIIKSSDKNGFCYLQTTNLDGESTLKPRESAKLFFKKIGKFEEFDSNCNSILNQCEIDVEIPNNNIYKLDGRFILKEKNENEMDLRGDFTVDNVILRGGTIKNVEYVIGMCLYTGDDTKLMKNIQSSSIKLSAIEHKLNKIVIILMISVFILCIICASLGFRFSVSTIIN